MPKSSDEVGQKKRKKKNSGYTLKYFGMKEVPMNLTASQRPGVFRGSFADSQN
jgi:hypothetical protein